MISEMKDFSYFKSQYKRAKTLAGKKSVMNRAMLNLSHDDQQKFVSWQTKQ
jgi:hypothetical protein